MNKILMICIFFCFDVSAQYRHFLYKPYSSVTIPDGIINFKGYTSYIDLDVTGGPNGKRQGRVFMSKCYGGGANSSARQEKTAWLIVPNYVNTGKIIVTPSLNDWNGWKKPAPPVPYGYDGKVIQSVLSSPLGECWPEGTNVEADFFWKNAKLRVTVPEQRLTPGSYNVKIPFYYAFEENKYTDQKSDSYDTASRIMLSGPAGDVNVRVDVIATCYFNQSQINLSHGTMIGRDADGNQTKPYTLSVSCTSGTSLTVKLLGAQSVWGKTNNYTRCGIGGMCELTFDNGKYDETITIYNTKSLGIKSTYHLNNITKPVAETFEGSGVLQILIN